MSCYCACSSVCIVLALWEGYQISYLLSCDTGNYCSLQESCSGFTIILLLMPLPCFSFQVNSTLFNDITMHEKVCGITLMKQTFSCSRDAAELLQISLETYKLSEELEDTFERLFNCTAPGGCKLPRLSSTVLELLEGNSTDVSEMLGCFIRQQYEISTV